MSGQLFFQKPLGEIELNPIFALPKPKGDGTGLTHGVTVALQILVLSVKVRILMGQQEKEITE